MHSNFLYIYVVGFRFEREVNTCDKLLCDVSLQASSEVGANYMSVPAIHNLSAPLDAFENHCCTQTSTAVPTHLLAKHVRSVL